MLDLNDTGTLSLYVDGADECDPHKRLIKGGGAALTREKIIAEASEQFVCIIDPAKQVPTYWAGSRCRSKSSRWRAAWWRAAILALTGGQPVWRQATAGGHRQRQRHPRHPRPVDHRPGGDGARLNQIPGVVSVGLLRGGAPVKWGTPAGGEEGHRRTEPK